MELEPHSQPLGDYTLDYGCQNVMYEPVREHMECTTSDGHTVKDDLRHDGDLSGVVRSLHVPPVH